MQQKLLFGKNSKRDGELMHSLKGDVNSYIGRMTKIESKRGIFATIGLPLFRCRSIWLLYCLGRSFNYIIDFDPQQAGGLATLFLIGAAGASIFLRHVLIVFMSSLQPFLALMISWIGIYYLGNEYQFSYSCRLTFGGRYSGYSRLDC